MAEFYVSLTSKEMSVQIANMVNMYNRWYTRFSPGGIALTPARYFVEVYGNKVVGCSSTLREYKNLSKIQHICVLPEYRRLGIAKRLAKLAIENSDTEYVYMTIREDNTASLAMAQSLGFRYGQKHWFRDHWTYSLARRRDGILNTNIEKGATLNGSM